MSGCRPDDAELRKILDAQSRPTPLSSSPPFARLAVLPPISGVSLHGAAPKTATPRSLRPALEPADSRPATTIGSRPTTTSIGYSVLPPMLKTKKATSIIPIAENENENPPATSSSRQVTPLYPIPRSNIAYNLNLDNIDENEVLRPSSIASTDFGILDDDDFDKLIVKLPKTFAEFRDIAVELDQISFETIDKMLINCRTFDENQSGFLSPNSVLTAIIDAISNPEIDEASSIAWKKFLGWLAEPQQLFNYSELFAILKDDKHSREAIIHLSDVLDSDDNGSVISHFPSRPTSSQAQREKGRAKLLIDLEVALDRNPGVDLQRFKTATDKKIIDLEEFKMLFQIFGLSEHLSIFEQRIIDCFMTHDRMFCFSAFVGCLDQMSPDYLARFKSARSKAENHALWMKPPLPKIGSSKVVAELDDSGVLLDASFSSTRDAGTEEVSDADFVRQLQNPGAKF